MLHRLAIIAAMASLCGCAALPTVITIGAEIVLKATELDTAFIENIRAATGTCVGRDLKAKPCPKPTNTSPEPTP